MSRHRAYSACYFVQQLGIAHDLASSLRSCTRAQRKRRLQIIALCLAQVRHDVASGRFDA